MKTKLCGLVVSVVLLGLFSGPLATARAQGTAFTYQGRLFSSTNPANGTYSVKFSLFTTNTAGIAVAGPVTNNGVVVTNGLFSVQVDFGPSGFTGQSNWLEVAVKTNSAGSFTTLTPRQQLTPAPYAIFAESASNVSGSVSAAQLTSIGNTNGGTANFFAGTSGNAIMSGGQNTGAGVLALQNNTTGTANTALGDSALTFNQSGSDNTAVGSGALLENTAGSFNTADGYSALLNNKTGGGNVAIGYGALYNNTSGSGNSAYGISALYANTNGSDNEAIGAYALFNNTNGSYNVAEGDYSFYTNSSGTNNIALGYQAGLNVTNGSSNIEIGSPGAAGDDNIIRIGTPGLQTNTYIAGTIQSPLFAGNVGINTTNPGAQLEVSGPNNTAIRISGPPGGGPGLAVSCDFATYNPGSGSPPARIQATDDGAYSDNLNLMTKAPGSAGNALQSRLYIASDGYVGIGTTGPGNLLVVGGSGSPAYCNGTTWVNGSDRNSKEGFAAIDSREMLAKVSALPITEWKYKVEPDGTEHLGPMAQDFHAAFHLNGKDDKHIATVDEEGVALAAIQGLNQKLEADEKSKDAEIEALKQNLADLKRLVQSLAEKK
jgi:hypothetical protein